ncbi:MAG: hypothetical protein FWG00_04160 [Coriobacteriia bacterium]|nr:hypothetical protein [Coriobacteriia bacterium]
MEDRVVTTPSEAEFLLALQESDFKLRQLKKQLDELPQRAKILDLRHKQREVEEKIEQVGSLRAENENTIRLLQDDEERAIAHRKETQSKIDESSDYKETGALTRELEAAVKKIEKIEFETLKQMEKLDKINEIIVQAKAALVRLQEQEAETVEDFKKNGSELQNAVLHETTLREKRATHLSDSLLKRYEKAVVAKGGIGAAYIEDDHCSACRMPYAEGQLMQLKSSGELAECPHCHRLLVTKR